MRLISIAFVSNQNLRCFVALHGFCIFLQAHAKCLTKHFKPCSKQLTRVFALLSTPSDLVLFSLSRLPHNLM